MLAAVLGIVALGTPALAVVTKAVPLRAPLATSLTTSQGTWVTLPMGRLDQPLNTFWQLFFLPEGGHKWSNHAGQLAVADNGGLLVAATGPRSVVVAIRPSNLLTFSALASTTDGRAWAPAPPIPGNVVSLGATAPGHELALVQSKAGSQVLGSFSAGPPWRRLATLGTLAGAPGARACRPGSLSAVAFVGQTPVIGADCAGSGVAGVFIGHATAWRMVGPDLSSMSSCSGSQVLSMRGAGRALSALFSWSCPSGHVLVQGWLRAGGQWALSDAMRLVPTDQLVSVGPAPGDGQFLLYRTTTGDERLALVAPGGRWSHLAAPPSQTATVAFTADGRIDALAGKGTVMTDWELRPGGWHKQQVVHVDIVYGSSN